MKSRIAQMITVGIALMGATAVYAQDHVMTADVPFAFYVGKTLMPQGSYRVSENPGTPVTWIMSKETAESRAVNTAPAGGTKDLETPRLVFHRVGEDYFLAELWPGTGTAGRSLGRTTREKQMTRQGMQPTLAVIAASLIR